MGAPILAVNANHPQPRVVARAVALLESGQLIAYPTDTCYGLGCDLLSKRGIDRLYQLKGADRRRPMSILVPELSDLSKYAKVSNFAYRVIRKLTPGPYTFVLDATRQVPEIMQTRQKTVGIRIPDHPVANELCKMLGRPIVTTSAKSGEEPLIGAGDIQEHLGRDLALILDGGTQLNEPSTILSLVGDQLEVLRSGKGDVSQLMMGG